MTSALELLSQPSEPEGKREFLPQPEEMMLSWHLYKKYSITMLDTDHFDCYCQICKKQTTFRGYGNPESTGHSPTFWVTGSQNFIVTAVCSRNFSHEIFFVFRVEDSTIQKIGQHPSIADLEEYSIKKYRNILGKERYRELSRAIGLVGHGVGTGAFVYLRRIFESLIEEAHSKAANNSNWDEEKYGKCRMSEKIELLRDFLPDFLVENHHIYSILSKGVHELSDEECLMYFDIVKTGIELILDEMIADAEKLKKAAEAKKALSQIQSKLGKPSP
jgi:hypothetical protein